MFFELEDLPCGAMDPAPPSSVPPKVLEAVGRHFGVSDGVLDVLVPEVVLQGARVVAIVGEQETLPDDCAARVTSYARRSFARFYAISASTGKRPLRRCAATSLGST